MEEMREEGRRGRRVSVYHLCLCGASREGGRGEAIACLTTTYLAKLNLEKLA
jgi:hypothetical protein